MGRIAEVIKNKNRVEKSQRARRKDEINQLKSKAAFNAALSDEMTHIETLLESNEIDYIVVQIAEENIAKFGEAIYSETMSGFDIVQKIGEPDKFIIRLKTIN